MQPNAKHQKDNADFSELVRQPLVSHIARRERPHHHTRHQIADKRRQAQPMGEGPEDVGEPQACHEYADQWSRMHDGRDLAEQALGPQRFIRF